MAQSIAATPLATLQAATSRQVAFQVCIDFADVGFANILSWTDVSALVKRIDGDMQATDWRKSIAAVGGGVSDSCTVTLQNPEDTGSYSGLRYSSSNEYSSLYTYIGDGLINMKRAYVAVGFTSGSTDYVTRQITGYIVGVGEQRQGRNITFEIRDRAADASLTRAATALYTDVTAKSHMQVLAAMLDKDALTSSEEVFDTGMIILPYAWLDDDSIWDEMAYVAEAQLGRVWWDKDGNLHFDDGSHFVKPSTNSYDNARTSQHTFTTANMRSVDARYDMGSIFNHVIVEYQPRYVACEQTVYTATETTVIPPANSRVVRCEFRYPLYSMTDPTVSTDIKAVTSGGTDISSDISYTATEYATYVELTLTNANTDFAAYVYKLDISGRPLLSEQGDKYEAENTTSIARYGRRTWRVTNPYVTTYRHAQMIGDYLLARYKDPIQVIRIAGARGVPWLEIGDRVTVVDSLSGLNDEFFLTHIRWSLAPGAAYTMDITAMRAADLFYYLDEYFILGTDIYGRPYLGSSDPDAYGRMFW